MSVLNNVQINELITDGILQNADRELVSAASIDVRLSPHMMVCVSDSIDTKGVEKVKWKELHTFPFTLLPGELYLASTQEKLILPADLAAQVSGKSTIGRLGLNVHITAGWIDPGFHGTITLEIATIKPIVVYPDMRIGQLIFYRLPNKSTMPYKGHYQDRQEGLPVVPTGDGLF